LNVREIFQKPRLSFLNLFYVLSLGGFGFFLVTSFKGSVELNWPSIFYPCAFVLVAFSMSRRKLLLNIFYWLTLYSLILSLGLSAKIPAVHQKLTEPFKVLAWKNLPHDYKPLFASTYQLASLMWWNSQVPVFKLKDSSRYDFFDERPESRPQADFYLLKEKGNNFPDWVQGPDWVIQEVQILDEKHMVFKITRKGKQ
jgi:hypothetical protein